MMQKILNFILTLFLSVFIFACAKDKNLDDYKREQLQMKLSRINNFQGSYTGEAMSKIDGSNLGVLSLNFEAKTDISSSSSQSANEQKASVSGSINLRSITTTEISFDDGYFDDVTGDFQVTIPIVAAGGTGPSSKLSLIGKIIGDQWIGVIEVKGQPEFGARLNLVKNAPRNYQTSANIDGARFVQMRRMNYLFSGTYKVGGDEIPFTLTFIDRNIYPEQHFFKLFSPVRQVSVNCNFTDFELNFTNAILDDKTGTLKANDPFDQRGNPARANLFCMKYDEGAENFGWDCEIQTKVTLLKLHLKAMQ